MESLRQALQSYALTAGDAGAQAAGDAGGAEARAAGGAGGEAPRSRASLELGVAAMGPTPFDPFDEDGVRYFHLQPPPGFRGFRAVAERWKHTRSDAPALAQARAVVDGFRPDLIHIHGSEGPMGLLAGMVEPPVLVSLQGILVVYERFFFAGLPVGEVARDAISLHFLKGEGMLHTHWSMEHAAARELQILRNCRYFAGRTDWDKSVLMAANPAARYYYGGEVLRPEFYAAHWAPSQDGPFRVYSTGGPAPYKGLVNLLEAVALLRGNTRRPAELRISGEVMSTGMGPVMERAMRRLGLEGAVVWLGPLGPEALIAELQTAGVYVHPSLADNSPNALAEAMVVGVPCVASAAGGVPSMITGGVDGLLCAPNDVYALAGKIAAIEADVQLAGGLAGAARARGRERHDPATIAAATMDMYADIIERHKREKP